MVTMVTMAASPMRVWEPQISPPGKKLPFPQAEGSLSLWGPATQAFQVPYCLTLGYLEVQSESSPREDL